MFGRSKKNVAPRHYSEAALLHLATQVVAAMEEFRSAIVDWWELSSAGINNPNDRANLIRAEQSAAKLFPLYRRQFDLFIAWRNRLPGGEPVTYAQSVVLFGMSSMSYRLEAALGYAVGLLSGDEELVQAFEGLTDAGWSAYTWAYGPVDEITKGRVYTQADLEMYLKRMHANGDEVGPVVERLRNRYATFIRDQAQTGTTS